MLQALPCRLARVRTQAASPQPADTSLWRVLDGHTVASHVTCHPSIACKPPHLDGPCCKPPNHAHAASAHSHARVHTYRYIHTCAWRRVGVVGASTHMPPYRAQHSHTRRHACKHARACVRNTHAHTRTSAHTHRHGHAHTALSPLCPPFAPSPNPPPPDPPHTRCTLDTGRSRIFQRPRTPLLPAILLAAGLQGVVARLRLNGVWPCRRQLPDSAHSRPCSMYVHTGGQHQRWHLLAATARHGTPTSSAGCGALARRVIACHRGQGVRAAGACTKPRATQSSRIIISAASDVCVCICKLYRKHPCELCPGAGGKLCREQGGPNAQSPTAGRDERGSRC